MILLWSTVYGIKWCYLAFFYPLLRAMSKKVIYYYWFAVVFSIVPWIYVVAGQQLVACPYFGKSAGKSFHPKNDHWWDLI